MATRRAFDAAHAARGGAPAATGLWSWITTVDHKRIGILYGVTAFAFFLLIGGLEALVIRLQLARPGNTVVSARRLQRALHHARHHHGVPGVMPLNAAFFNYLVPLHDRRPRRGLSPAQRALLLDLPGRRPLPERELPGRDAARTAAGSATRASPRGSTRPVTASTSGCSGLQILGASSLIAGVNFIVTILNMRAPGMTLMRMPVFVWMTLVVQFLIVLAFPPVTVGLIFLMFDRFFGTHFYDVAAGGDLHLWQHLFWIFGHPEVYILILPAFGHRLRGAADLRAQAAVRRARRDLLRRRSSASSASACGATTCSRRAWARWPTPPSPSPPC